MSIRAILYLVATMTIISPIILLSDSIITPWLELYLHRAGSDKTEIPSLSLILLGYFFITIIGFYLLTLVFPREKKAKGGS